MIGDIKLLLIKLKNSTSFRNGVLFSIFSFANQGINFILLLILSKFIDPSDYGELNLFTTFVALMGLFITLNSQGIISVNYFKGIKENTTRYISVVCLIAVGLLLLLSCLLLLYAPLMEKLIGLRVQYQWFALFVCYMQVFTSINLDIWRLEEKPVSYGIYSVSSVTLNFVTTLILVILFHLGWLGRLYAQLGVTAIFCFLSCAILYFRGYLKLQIPGKEYFRAAFSFGIPLIPHSLSWWLRQGVDRYIINFFHTSIAVGFYGFAYNFANILQIVGMAFNASYSVTIYKKLSEEKENTANILLKHTCLMFLFYLSLSLCVYIGARILIPIVMPMYVDSITYLFPLCTAAFFNCIYLLFVNYLFFFKKTKKLMYITFSISVLHMLLSFILVRYSVAWAAYLSLISNFLITVCVVWYSQRIYRLPWKNIFNSLLYKRRRA